MRHLQRAHDHVDQGIFLLQDSTARLKISRSSSLLYGEREDHKSMLIITSKRQVVLKENVRSDMLLLKDISEMTRLLKATS